MDYDNMPPRVVFEKVAEGVLGWRRDGDFWWIGEATRWKGVANVGDLSFDHTVLTHIRNLRDAEDHVYNWFWHFLERRLRSRDPYYSGTIPDFKLGYIEEYWPGDYSISALEALDAGEFSIERLRSLFPEKNCPPLSVKSGPECPNCRSEDVVVIGDFVDCCDCGRTSPVSKILAAALGRAMNALELHASVSEEASGDFEFCRRVLEKTGVKRG